MEPFLDHLRSLSAPQAALLFLIANLGIFLISVASCWSFGRLFPRRRLFDRWEPFSKIEFAAAMGAVLLNSGVSVIGWALWKDGHIVLRPTSALRAAGDTLLMLLAMDLGMYVLHRLAHHPRIYPLFHRFHHRHEVTNPISLFVLHPLEVLGFGGLMILFLILVSVSPIALVTYLTLNVVFGTLGHSGVEPFFRGLRKIPLLNLVGTSTFHAEHHEHPAHNFGFYTLIWDQLFGTLDPDYWNRYAAAATPRTDP